MSAPKYAALFLAESREHLAGCDRLLLTWERDPAALEPIHGLFRAVHNIKGMAATGPKTCSTRSVPAVCAPTRRASSCSSAPWTPCGQVSNPSPQDRRRTLPLT